VTRHTLVTKGPINFVGTYPCILKSGWRWPIIRGTAKIAEVSTRADFDMAVKNGWVVPYLSNDILAGKAGALRNTDSLGLHELEASTRANFKLRTVTERLIDPRR
jgi:hypothetical protein